MKIKNSETAPAKLNLALDILRRREDGYHDLRMVMQTVSLSDAVAVEEPPEAESGQAFILKIDGASFSAGEKSLEQRAAEAFFSYIGEIPPPLRVTLRKVIPAYAGLGGGSADVAALLRLLRERYRPSLATAELERIGLTVGSDVPFCVRGGTCLAEGRGEILTDLPPLPECGVVICKPDFGLPTPELFARADRAEPGAFRERPDIDGMAEALRRRDLSGVAERLRNVFEDVLPEEAGAAVSAIQERMRALGALNAAMSGSGPAVFGLFREREAAQRAAAVLKQDYREAFFGIPMKKAEIFSPEPDNFHKND